MPTEDPRVDAYIAKAPAFAQPILHEVRARIRAAVPGVEETIKWNVPFFVAEGKLLASMAGFKKHAKIGVWRGTMPSFVDVTTVEELPPAKAFAKQVKDALANNDEAMTSGPEKKAGAAVRKEAAAPKKKSASASQKASAVNKTVRKKA